MMKVIFNGYNDDTDKFEDFFELNLEEGKLTASNAEGKTFLANMLAMEEAGMSLPDTRLYAAGKYEELMRFFVEKYHTPYLTARKG